MPFFHFLAYRNANLSKLFGVEMENEAEEDSKSFKYIPQKPEESPESENVQMNWNVCLAKIITAYKLIKTENKQENTGNNKSSHFL